MKYTISLFFLLACVLPVSAQSGFHFVNEKEKVSIPFKFINNLVFIPIKVNGIELNFLLDSGVEETILFSLEDKKEVRFFNIEKITLRGLGSADAVEGLKSTNNVLETHGLIATNHLLYVVLDQEFNLSSHVGIPVNGIIGYNFLKNNLVEINYEKKRVVVYKDTDSNKKKIEKKFKKIPITIERYKPYVMTDMVLEGDGLSAKLLIDIGNSDALWLFQNLSKAVKIPAKNFDDYLGQGFSGDILGKRARISKFTLADFVFEKPIAAFPDTSSIKNVKMVPGRLGSVGGEILKRFTVVFDYQNKLLYLKKNREYYAPFTYNKSGIELQHFGLQWVEETVRLETVPAMTESYHNEGVAVSNDFKYKFQLKPVYQISNVRKDSPAANSGLQKGDIVISINNNKGYKYTLQEINSLLKSEEEKWITIEVERDSQILKFKFLLKDIL
ncbi:PDZ domain (Also known as DHR or GLGF) [compost metagenome]